MKYIDADKLIEGIKHLQSKFPVLTYEALFHLIASLQQEQPEGLDDAARKELQVYLPQDNGPDGICYFIAPQMLAMYKAGAEYMAGQGVSMEITPEVDWTDVDKFVYLHSGDNVIIQIRKRKEKEK